MGSWQQFQWKNRQLQAPLDKISSLSYLSCDRQTLKFGRHVQQRQQRLDLVVLNIKSTSCFPMAWYNAHHANAPLLTRSSVILMIRWSINWVPRVSALQMPLLSEWQQSTSNKVIQSSPAFVPSFKPCRSAIIWRRGSRYDLVRRRVERQCTCFIHAII